MSEWDAENWAAISILVVVGLGVFWLLVHVAIMAFVGAVVLFEFAHSAGFFGVAIYIACWGLFLPVMLVVSLVIGLFYRLNKDAE